MSDWSQAAVVAAQLLDDLETAYGDDIEVGHVMIVVEISGDVGTDDEWTGVHYRCSEARRWVQAGLLTAARRACYASSETPDEDDE